ncbi:MAG: BTAD domain-containing putative transcriptional regulator [Nitriliruptorales bacterium]|nr:BTAD domain-containing putative transcriptional regulator [Nitriliruptorales bacterium]
MRFLGRPEVLVAGDPLHVDTRKSTALLACLAIEGQVRRDVLAALLWPESDRSRARGALRRTLSVTTRSLGGVSLDAGRDLLALPRDDVDCDLWAFERDLGRVTDHGDEGKCPTCLNALAAAVTLRRGSFLEAFALRNCPEFEEWQSHNDEHLRRRTCDALDWLVRGHAANGTFDAAITFAERRLDLDPLHERTYRQLMLLHTWTGRRSAAVDSYRQCVVALNRELGVEPLEETTALYERLVDGDVPPPPAAGGLGPTVSPGRSPVAARPAPPLVGRNAELAALVDQFDGTGPNGRVTVIEGEAGIGRTRPLDELVAHARGQALGADDVAGLHEALGDLHTREGDHVAALGSYEMAAAHRSDDPAGRAVIEQKLAGVHLRRGDRLAADAHLGVAPHLIGDTGALAGRARILADRALSSLRSSDPQEAEALASEALALATVTNDVAALAQVHNLLGMVARRANRMDEARQHARQSLEFAIAFGDPPARIAATNNLGLIERASGNVEAAVELLEDALRRCRWAGDRHVEALLANNLADALYDAGRRDEAMARLKDAVARFGADGDADVLRPEIWKLVDW